MNLPARDFQSFTTGLPTPLPNGLDRLAHDLTGQLKRRDKLIQQWLALGEDICAEADTLTGLSDQELRIELNRQRQLFRRQKKDVSFQIPTALALIIEAAERTLGLRPFPVQVLGAIMIANGYLAEMATGEGKTLTAGLSAILLAWSDRPCHIITANDYLAQRDAKQMAPLYRFCHLTTGFVGSEMSTLERKENYQKEIVYTTSKELLADFLRDRLAHGNATTADRMFLRKMQPLAQKWNDCTVMRGIHTAIIDEADSVLIDEAVTPLIISSAQQNQPFAEAIVQAVALAQSLAPQKDYQTNTRYREIKLTEEGERHIADLTSQYKGFWQNESRRKEMIITALTAKEFYLRGREYVIEQDKLVIVDELTGRMMPHRTWRQGLHQSIEVLEGLPLSDPSETQARLSFQRFFRLFRHLGGMTGTAKEAEKELWHIYNLPVLSVPTNRPCIRKQLPNRYATNKKNKWLTLCAEVLECNRTGQPVLIGTRNIKDSESLAELLRKQGVKLQLLNAVQHKEEAEIIATAGQRGKVTIATNMAGRGADIKLGRGVAKLGGLHVIVSERHESKRIDRQLIGRCARQGQPGSYRLYSSLEDDILRRFSNKPLLALLHKKIRKTTEQQQLFEKIIRRAQQNAQKQAFRQRQAVMQADDWLSEALSFSATGIER